MTEVNCMLSNLLETVCTTEDDDDEFVASTSNGDTEVLSVLFFAHLVDRSCSRSFLLRVVYSLFFFL